VEKDTKNYLKNTKRPRDNEEQEQNIKGDLKTCVELSDEKVALAVQTYELVIVMTSFRFTIETRRANTGHADHKEDAEELIDVVFFYIQHNGH
jgi:hypothetical protein